MIALRVFNTVHSMEEENGSDLPNAGSLSVSAIVIPKEYVGRVNEEAPLCEWPRGGESFAPPHAH